MSTIITAKSLGLSPSPLDISAEATPKLDSEIKPSAAAPAQPSGTHAARGADGSAGKDDEKKGPMNGVEVPNGPVTPAVKSKAAPSKILVELNLDHLVLALFLGLVAVLVLLCLMLRPSAWHLATFSAVGTGIGLAFSLVYYDNVKSKAEMGKMMGLDLGLKGLQYLVGSLPSWLSYTEQEKIEWLNQLLAELWPFFDKAVCRMLKAQLEAQFATIIKAQKVPIQRITFKQLTFGEAPFRVESIWVNKGSHNGLEIEMEVRWCGEANITLAVQLISAGVTMEICPQVCDISFVGLVKIRLGPLMDKLPGFAASVVTLKRIPRLKYYLNFGALGGSIAASIVKPFINSLIQDNLVAMLVWPTRLVTPSIVTNDPEILNAIDRMRYHHWGLLKVELIRCENLASVDWNGRSDPFVRMTTDAKHWSESSVKPATLNPVYGESFWHLVQEPETQEMRLSVMDFDLLSGSDLIGRALVPLKAVTEMEDPATREPGQLCQWYHLGEGEFSEAAGCGKGRGRVQLRMTYRSLANMPAGVMAGTPSDCAGILIVRIIKCSRVTTKKGIKQIFCTIKVDEEKFQTGYSWANVGEDHIFYNNNMFEFYQLKGLTSDLKIQVWEKSLAGQDVLGVLEQPIAEIAEAKDVSPLTGKPEVGLMAREMQLEDSDYGLITIQARYVACI